VALRAGAYDRLFVPVLALALRTLTGRAERAVTATLGLGFRLAGPVAWLLLPGSDDATLVTG